MCFSRTYNNKTAIVVINNSNKNQQVEFFNQPGTNYTEYFSGNPVKITDKFIHLECAALSGLVLFSN
ncbi:MAG: alpha-glucosidase C-terminal domain-containing protein [Bacteroidetes bacterium]|nr:alpha-glucosidase C-terminal domain-containing protein [Bacteroidota bacterium]